MKFQDFIPFIIFLVFIAFSILKRKFKAKPTDNDNKKEKKPSLLGNLLQTIKSEIERAALEAKKQRELTAESFQDEYSKKDTSDIPDPFEHDNLIISKKSSKKVPPVVDPVLTKLDDIGAPKKVFNYIRETKPSGLQKLDLGISKKEIKKAIIMSEILGKPKGLKDQF